jgi:uncharacterized protein (UPF0335 family)
MRRTHRPTFVATVTLLACVVALAASGCVQKQPAEQPVEHTVRKVTPATEPERKKADTQAKEQFERALNMKLERLDEEIREVQARVTNLTAAAKAEWTDKMADLAAKRKTAEAKLDEVRKSAAGAWEHLREGADRAWEELEQAVQKARKEF